jgi:hypothetical protein
LRKFLELVEGNDEISTWGLVDRLVAHHVKLLLKITVVVWWAMFICPAGRLCISVTLAIGVLR